MIILILGNGTRAEIICENLISQNNIIHQLHIDIFSHIKTFCLDNNIELVIPTTEFYLCNGIVDYLSTEIPLIKIFGPNKIAAHIEDSKQFSKWIMTSLNLPTASYRYFDNEYLWNKEDKSFIEPANLPVIKYSGLTHGNSIYLPSNIEELEEQIQIVFELGPSGIILEERLFGTEVSILAFCNGKEGFLMPQAQNYKHINDDNIGLNTCGMGAICPANILTHTELQQIKEHMDIIVKHLDYKGVLCADLIKTNAGVFFLEFNCRFGYLEAQVILNLLESNLLTIMLDCIAEKNLDIQWKNKFCAAVVLSHEDYPLKKLDYQVRIFYEPLDNTVKIYEANIKNENGFKYTTGGQVMTMISISDTLSYALQNIYNNIHKIEYDGIYYRRDIGCNNLLPKIQPNVLIGILASSNGTCLEYLFQERVSDIKIIIATHANAGIIKKAAAHKIPYCYIPQHTKDLSLFYEKIVTILQLHKVDLVILSDFMKIVPETLSNEILTVNIHPSLLPYYRGYCGISVHRAVLENNETFSGCTLHTINKDTNKERILLQKQYKISENETPESLFYNIQELEKRCILEFITIFYK